MIDGLNRDLEAPLSITHAGEKGRGVFADTKIPKHTFVCEYKTTNVYDQKQYDKRNKEMEANDEICSIVEYRVGKSILYFDATRRFNQYGKYMNHGRREANVKIHRPLTIRGRLRIGMYSIRDIEFVEELVWDYGIKRKDMPWEGKILLYILIYKI